MPWAPAFTVKRVDESEESKSDVAAKSSGINSKTGEDEDCQPMGLAIVVNANATLPSLKENGYYPVTLWEWRLCHSWYGVRQRSASQV